jgi:hypothetical protein
MEMDDHDFTLVRKNLNILSVLILILAFTNAQLHSINLLGIEMDLDAIKLYQALFIGYLYFIWRFLTKLPLRSGFWNDFEQHYITSEYGVKKQHTYERYKQQFIDSLSQLKSTIKEGSSDARFVQLNVVRQNNSLVKLKLSAVYQIIILIGNRQQQHNIDIDIKVSRLYFLRKVLIFCFKYDKFGDYLFPLIPVITVVGCFIFKSEWQGSFAGLFLR